MELGDALNAVCEVLDDDVELSLPQLAIEIRRNKFCSGTLIRGLHKGHVSSSRSILRPRWMRLLTVPIGASTASDISS